MASVLRPPVAHAWGVEGHRDIMARAIALLPDAIRPYFDRQRTVLVERVMDPDLWRTVGFEAEHAHHFLNMDAYGAPPFASVPREYEAAVKQHGRDFVAGNGMLPWRAEEMYRRLVAAFRRQDGASGDSVINLAAWLAHYVGDAHVPFHAARNSDGQLTKQEGIHARFESALFARYRERLTIVPGPLRPASNARDVVFDALAASFRDVDGVLAADAAAAPTRRGDETGYYATMFRALRPVLERRVTAATVDTASVIAAAWIEAGRPALSNR